MGNSKATMDLEKKTQAEETASDSEMKSIHVVENTTEFASSTLESTGKPQLDALRIKHTARWQMFAVCFSLFLAGWDGGTMGPLLPRIQSFYHVNCMNFFTERQAYLLILGRLLDRFASLCLQLCCKISHLALS